MHVEVCEKNLERAARPQLHGSDAACDSQESLNHKPVEPTTIESTDLNSDDEHLAVEKRTISAREKVDILECLVTHCPRSMRRQLGFLAPDDSVHVVPEDTAELKRALREKFSLDSLVNCGIFVVRDEGAVDLAPALKQGASFIALRDAASNLYYELLTETGCLDASALPVLEILHDDYTQSLIEEGNRELIATFDLEHAILLRACGLPATLATGLDDVPLELVDQLCEAFDWTSLEAKSAKLRAEYSAEDWDHSTDEEGNEGDAAAAANTVTDPEPDPADFMADPCRAQLILLASSPLELSYVFPIKLKTVVEQLHQLEKFMDLNLEELCGWIVCEKAIDQLRFFAEKRNTEKFRQTLHDSIQKNVVGFRDFGKKKPRRKGKPTDYATAVARYKATLPTDNWMPWMGLSAKKEACGYLQHFLSKDVIDPLRQMAAITQDPIDKNLLTAFAEISHIFHMQSVTVSDKLDRRIADSGSDVVAQVPDDACKKMMAMADCMTAIAKVLKRCK